MLQNFEKLKDNIPKQLTGDWITHNSNYEKALCLEIGWTCMLNRYFDSTYENISIEIKKGKSI